MLVNSEEILKRAKEGKYAVPQFNINNLEWTKYILEQANKMKVPVILGVSEGAIKHMGGYNTVVNIVIGLIQDMQINIPIVLHLDHGSSFESCQKAIDAGFTSVMIDASHLELQQNINLTKEVVDYAHRRNVTVEAEIGTIAGEEDDVINEESFATLEDSIIFYENTNIDSIAPSLGSVHGIYKGVLNLQFETMKKINDALPIPLVLHGGTGISETDIKKAISCGISKININTELQVEWGKKVRKYLNDNQKVYDPRKIIGAGEEAIKKAVQDKITLFKE